MFMPWELPKLLDPDLVRQGWDTLQTLTHLEQTTARITDPHLRIAALEMTWYMRHQLLRDTDWASMDHSLEVRTPLVDCELLRKIAPLLLGPSRPDKQAMARTPERPLPPEVLNRTKTGFSVPVREWLLQEDADFRAERGLRGWTRLVYSACLADRQGSLHLTRAAMGRRGSNALQSSRAARKVLIFRIGQLGDTIAALPALWTVRTHFPDAELTLLCDRHPGKPHVFGPDLLKDSGLFKRFEFYPVRDGTIGRAWQVRDMFKLLGRLKKERFDTLVYLSPSARTRRQIARDVRFFRLAGIKNFIGTDGFAAAPTRIPGRPLDEVPHEAELLLARMAASHIPVPASGRGCMDLCLGAKEQAEFDAWLRNAEAAIPSPGGEGKGEGEPKNRSTETPKHRSTEAPPFRPTDLRPLTTDLSSALRPPSSDKPWIGFGPGSKMPSKRWPLERFVEVGRGLIERFDIWPVVFGGVEDSDDANHLLAAWGRGYSAAGKLSVRAAAVALKRCELYVGNDTGTMHLAASVDTKCVAIFSSRDWPGRWYPYGEGHRVFRTQIECEGCGLVECVERRNECLDRITAAEVLAGCETLLGEGDQRSEIKSQTELLQKADIEKAAR
jgi:ADP-heptose:LPS heptosyltransferase